MRSYAEVLREKNLNHGVRGVTRRKKINHGVRGVTRRKKKIANCASVKLRVPPWLDS